jgi:hypothetical protein
MISVAGVAEVCFSVGRGKERGAGSGENKADEGTAELRVNQGFLRMRLSGALSLKNEDVCAEKVKIMIDPSRRTIATFGYQVVERTHNI